MIKYTRTTEDIDRETIKQMNSPNNAEYYPMMNVSLELSEENGMLESLEQWLGVFRTILQAEGFHTNTIDRLCIRE